MSLPQPSDLMEYPFECIGLATKSCRKSLGISPALMRLFPNFFLWYVGTTRQDLFTVICTERHDVPFS